MQLDVEPVRTRPLDRRLREPEALLGPVRRSGEEHVLRLRRPAELGPARRRVARLEGVQVDAARDDRDPAPVDAPRQRGLEHPRLDDDSARAPRGAMRAEDAVAADQPARERRVPLAEQVVAAKRDDDRQVGQLARDDVGEHAPVRDVNEIRFRPVDRRPQERLEAPVGLRALSGAIDVEHLDVDPERAEALDLVLDEDAERDIRRARVGVRDDEDSQRRPRLR